MTEHVLGPHRQLPEQAASAIAGTLIFVGAGWMIASSSTRLQVLALMLGLGTIFVFAALRNVGATAGILVLAVMNGIPGVDLESYTQTGSFRPADLAVVALVFLLGLGHLRPAGAEHEGRLLQVTRWWAFLLGSWWTITLLRSVLFDNLPVLKAALFGRDFLYLAILFPLFLGGLRGVREIFGLLGALAAGALVFAFGHLAIVFGAGGLGHLIVHETISNEFGGVQRIYALMADVVAAAFPVGIGLTLMAQNRRARLIGLTLMLVTGLSVLLQFARATYFGLFFGLVFTGAYWVSRRSGTKVARRLAASIALLALVVGLAIVNGSSRDKTFSSPTFNGSAPPTVVIAARISSGIHDLTTKTGTVGYRFQVDRNMLHVLGGKWPIGLGFWHPDVKPVAGLPDNSIRNGDVGVLNSLMTMGAVGTVLLYLAPIGVLIAILRRRRHATIRPYDWFFFGAAAWIVAVIIGSISLVTLFTTSGLVFTAAALGVVLQLLAHERAAES